MEPSAERKTKIKLCGLSRECDIEAANELLPEYIGFVFAKKSIRYVSPVQAAALRKQLAARILAVGVFVNETPENIAELLAAGVIDIAQLHGSEDETYIERLRTFTDKPIIKAFSVKEEQDIRRAAKCSADLVLLDAGSGGTGTAFDWGLLAGMERPYFLAGGLDATTVGKAVRKWKPYAVDVSSGIETGGHKDVEKMRTFVRCARSVRKELL